MPVSYDHLLQTAVAYLATRPDQRVFLQPLFDLLDQGVDLADRSEWRGHAIASAVILNAGNQILHVDHVASGLWLPSPGGHLEPGDRSLRQAVLRELDEELGLAAADLRWLLDDVPVYIDVYSIPTREARREPGHLHLDFMYLLRTERTAFRLQQDEVRGTDWRPINALHDPQLRVGVNQALVRLGALR